jgi:regulator of chromosome condensation
LTIIIIGWVVKKNRILLIKIIEVLNLTILSNMSSSLSSEHTRRMIALNNAFVSSIQSALIQNPSSDFEDAGKDYCEYVKQLNKRLKPIPGNVFSWGSGDCGQLGHGVDDPTLMEVGQPKRIESIHKKCRLLVAGGLTNAVCTTSASSDEDNNNEQILTWGCGDDGALGRLGDENYPEPLPLLPSVIKSKVVQLTCGDTHGTLLTMGGEIFAWGSFRDKDGKTWFPFPSLTTNSSNKKYGPGSIAKEPTKLTSLNNIIQIASGSNHVLVLKGDNTVWTFGIGEQGQLGRAVTLVVKDDDEYDYDVITKHLIPAQVGINFPVKSIGAGGYHSLLISSIRCRMYGFGLNQYRQISGSVEDNIIQNPIELKFFDGKRISKCDGGEHFSCALSENGELWAWGRCDQSQLGTGNNGGEAGSFSSTPVRVSGPLLNQTVADFTCGSSHTLAITAPQGELYSWGFGVMLQLGHGEDKDEPLPRKINGINGVKSVSAGGQHSVALV